MEEVNFYEIPFGGDGSDWTTDLKQAFALGRLAEHYCGLIKKIENRFERMKIVRISGDYGRISAMYLCKGMEWPMPKKKKRR